MFQQLTKYFTQYKQVSIPEVGSFELVYQSATLDVANKLLQPPSYFTNYSKTDLVKEHQLNFLAVHLQTDKPSVEKQLIQFGKELKNQIQSDSFLWKGIGRLENRDTRILFHPDYAETEVLQPIVAERVLREDAMHTVLVGEKEVQRSHVPETAIDSLRKKPVAIIVGWILAVLAIGAILFMLYRGNFQSTATGNKWKVTPSSNRPTSK